MAQKPRRRAQLTEPRKLWLTPQQGVWLDAKAMERKWSVPQVIRECIDLVRERRLL